ncbi:uncharacterized protein ACRADG_002742 [Cochliomyia hominivorax]
MDKSVEIFHANCLLNWNTYNCPVCYYIKNPDLMKNSACMKCDTSDSLWFCIICAHVGCGHGVQGHAIEHFKDTTHRYVMELQGFNVWDYQQKKFLHNFDDKEQRLDNLHTFNQFNSDNNCSCPVCQHMRTPKLLKESVCMECEEKQSLSLWICLFCSHIGCGRHYNRHALEHYTKTKHPYSMQMDNFSIWDYKEHKYLHRQLHENVVKTEIVEFNTDHIKEDFEKRMDRLEREWQQFSRLTEANKKMITIEERLLTLTDEKKILEEKLYEHDAKLNELLVQFVGKCDTSLVPNPLASTKTLSNDILKNIKLEQITDDAETSSTASTLSNHNVRKPKGISNSFISLIILGLFVYYFFRLLFQNIAEYFMNFL